MWSSLEFGAKSRVHNLQTYAFTIVHIASLIEIQATFLLFLEPLEKIIKFAVDNNGMNYYAEELGTELDTRAPRQFIENLYDCTSHFCYHRTKKVGCE